MNLNKKSLNVILGVFLYIFAPFFFVIINKFGLMHKYFLLYSRISPNLVWAIRIGLPILILLIPFLIKLIYKTDYYKRVIIALLFIILYIPYNMALCYGIVSSFSHYTEKKWHNYPFMRGYMLDDMESKIKPINKEIKKIEKQLGKPEYRKNNHYCYTIDIKNRKNVYYCLYLNKELIEKTLILKS